MEKLVMYKDKFFFLQAVNFDKYDMEFEILNLSGERLGSTIYGFNGWEKFFESVEEKDDFMSWLDVEAHKEEATMKFAFEFNLPIEKANQLDLSTVEIMDIMESKWSIPVEIMDSVLQ